MGPRIRRAPGACVPWYPRARTGSGSLLVLACCLCSWHFVRGGGLGRRLVSSALVRRHIRIVNNAGASVVFLIVTGAWLQ
ncbi:hypothetical protein ARZXY2_4326 (plasmid) [Arthrobacter sp. ZXY-2]|nr:hypothetical protein ARZXY2_4326 [Arthrobacter sp. ZXY-2]